MEVVVMSIGKKDIVERVKKEAGLTTTAQAARAVESVLNGITAGLKKGDKVTFVGFGSFSVTQRKARKGRNPQTGKEIKIPAKKVPHFTAGAGLKDAVGGKKK